MYLTLKKGIKTKYLEKYGFETTYVSAIKTFGVDSDCYLLYEMDKLWVIIDNPEYSKRYQNEFLPTIYQMIKDNIFELVKGE